MHLTTNMYGTVQMGRQSPGPAIQADAPGEYVLEVISNGCSSFEKINVLIAIGRALHVSHCLP